jgi:hypothetical protein
MAVPTDRVRRTGTAKGCDGPGASRGAEHRGRGGGEDPRCADRGCGSADHGHRSTRWGTSRRRRVTHVSGGEGGSYPGAIRARMDGRRRSPAPVAPVPRSTASRAGTQPFAAENHYTERTERLGKATCVRARERARPHQQGVHRPLQRARLRGQEPLVVPRRCLRGPGPSQGPTRGADPGQAARGRIVEEGVIEEAAGP